MSLWRKRDQLSSLLFEYSAGAEDESLVSGKYLSACFSICPNENRASIDDFDSEAENLKGQHRMRFRNKFRDIEVTRTLIEFGRSFIVGSVTGGALRNSQSVNVRNAIATAMRTFSSCKHRNVTTEAVTPEPVCDSYAQYSLSQGRKAEEFVSSVNRLAGVLSEAGLIKKGNQFQ